MPIVRERKDKNGYTVIMNNIFREKELSLKAKGLLCYAISLPDNWRFSKRGIMKACTDKEGSIETALKELEEHFYLTRERIREKGKFNTVYTFYEVPYCQRQIRGEKTVRLKTRGRQVIQLKRAQ